MPAALCNSSFKGSCFGSGCFDMVSLSQNLVMQHVDHSAGDLIHLLQGLLRYDPADRLTAPEALRHPFFTRDNLRR